MTVEITELEKPLEPFENKLRAQERRRRRLGVKTVGRPTYERYIVGPIERFDSRRNIFAAMIPDNPFGQVLRDLYQRRRGVDHYSKPLPPAELEMADRPAQALDKAVWRLCREYYPELLPVTDPEGRFAFSGPDGPERMSRLINKVALWLGAELVGIAELDQRWVYADRDIAHRYAIVCAVPHDRRLNATAPSHLSASRWLRPIRASRPSLPTCRLFPTSLYPSECMSSAWHVKAAPATARRRLSPMASPRTRRNLSFTIPGTGNGMWTPCAVSCYGPPTARSGSRAGASA